MEQSDFDRLRLELSVNAKNGVDFIASASLVWILVGYVWTLPYSAYDRSVLTFIVGSITIPLAFGLSKVFKTKWKSPGNPLEPLGLWLNFAQLFYFPFLVLVLLTNPQFFVTTYAIITGAHFFPYAWYYKSMPFAVMAGVISVGALLLGLWLPADQMYVLAFAMSGALAMLGVLLMISWKANAREWARLRSDGAQGPDGAQGL